MGKVSVLLPLGKLTQKEIYHNRDPTELVVGGDKGHFHFLEYSRFLRLAVKPVPEFVLVT